jgi:hypothetical protein
MEDDIIELAAITNLLLFLTEVQLANDFARQPNGKAAFSDFAETIADRIQHRSRPEPGATADEGSLEIQARMLTRWHRLAASTELRRAEIRALKVGDPG